MVHLIVSVDYELFGNGAGDVWRDMIRPTNRMLRIAERYGAKLSLMFEAAEYAAFAKAESQGDWILPDSPSRAIAAQVQETFGGGHDVQLHLHPQFIGARRRNGLWQLDHGSTRLADLPGGLGDEHTPRSIVGALADGKRLLEDLLRPVDSSYRCLVLRAGGFFIQPAAKVIQALKQVGIVADSSVVPGDYVPSPWPLDFRAAPRDRSHWWTCENDITRIGPTRMHVLELPVAAHTRPYAYNFKWHKLRAALKRRRV